MSTVAQRHNHEYGQLQNLHEEEAPSHPTYARQEGGSGRLQSKSTSIGNVVRCFTLFLLITHRKNDRHKDQDDIAGAHHDVCSVVRDR